MMLLLLAQSQKSGIELACKRFGLEGHARSNGCAVFKDIDGRVASTIDHLRGLEAEGFIVLEPVSAELINHALHRVRRCGNGAPVVKNFN